MPTLASYSERISAHTLLSLCCSLSLYHVSHSACSFCWVNLVTFESTLSPASVFKWPALRIVSYSRWSVELADAQEANERRTHRQQPKRRIWISGNCQIETRTHGHTNTTETAQGWLKDCQKWRNGNYNDNYSPGQAPKGVYAGPRVYARLCMLMTYNQSF